MKLVTFSRRGVTSIGKVEGRDVVDRREICENFDGAHPMFVGDGFCDVSERFRTAEF